MGQYYPGAVYLGASSGGGGTPSGAARNSYTMSPAPDGTTTVFTVQGVVSAASPLYVDVFRNGVYQSPNAVDVAIDGSGMAYQVTFTSAPLAGDTLAAVY